jgi:hypothetical protein
MKRFFNAKIIFFCIGCILGLSLNMIYNYLGDNGSEDEYYELKSDYYIGNKGFIKSGALVRFDKAMPESFSRYILYLNIHSGEVLKKYKTDKQHLIIPYWLNSEIDSIGSLSSDEFLKAMKHSE